MFVISLGGSLIAPQQLDTQFLQQFHALVQQYLAASHERLILVVGGGSTARQYQSEYCRIAGSKNQEAQDWIGIMATRLNAELVSHIMHPYCTDAVVYNPTKPITFTGRVLVAAGWKPGFSTDYDAVCLAQQFNADTVVNLSNIDMVYTADPHKDPNAQPLTHISWKKLQSIIGTEWSPGKNAPFDPIAAKYAAKLRLRVIIANGNNFANVTAILHGNKFKGTVITTD